ncbi:hypothetical protein [Desulforhopalus singaporensis]|uniref:Uncharacterized protein n=1 Tax=Desulforhopalus singaporensis TaxID=91360 RepID=A0A1H0R224_9BACT|nr:hypothetical protein [Desulforhopalus singaporensis]SDP23435.1 hypothetical protein SAMN05660330_02175 [Desulforhopalus singaporensis]
MPGSSLHVGTMVTGALISEGAFLDGNSHSSGAFTSNGAVVWQISSGKNESFRTNKTELFYCIVSRIAVGINRRLRLLIKQMYDLKKDAVVLGGFVSNMTLSAPRKFPTMSTPVCRPRV